VYEFRRPIGGTYPPWYDPSYWNDGTEWRFDLVAQGRVLLQGALVLARVTIETQAGLLAIVLVWLMMSWRNTSSAMRRNWSLIGIGLSGVGIYLPVYVAERYVAAFLVLFGIAVLAAIRLPSDENSLRITKYLGIAGLVVVSLSLVATTFRVVARPIPDLAREHVDVAIALRETGFQQGDEVAVIGDGTGAYWAQLARLKIVAEIMGGRKGSEEFWAASPDLKGAAYQAFAGAGAHAVVTRKPVCDLGPEWRRLAGTEYYIHSFSP